jgi:hypothetical protein
MRSILTWAAGTAAVAVLFAASPSAARRADDPTLEEILAKAVAYLEKYRTDLSYMTATERQSQTLTGGFAIGGPQKETLASDIYFVYVPADKVWMALRDVEIVNGKVLTDRANMRSLVDSGQIGAARALKDQNAKYNLGTIVRNFNEPTLALTVLGEQHRRRFTFTRISSRGSRHTVAFVEHTAPTLIMTTAGTPAYSRGELTIDAPTGRIERSVITVRLGNVDATLETTYAREPALNMWVPSEFKESYKQTGRRPEKVDVESKYSDYSRFDVSVRIK